MAPLAPKELRGQALERTQRMLYVEPKPPAGGDLFIETGHHVGFCFRHARSDGLEGEKIVDAGVPKTKRKNSLGFVGYRQVTRYAGFSGEQMGNPQSCGVNEKLPGSVTGTVPEMG